MQNIKSERKLSIGEASEYLGVSIDTLRRWEKKGKIEPMRSPGGHRYFNKKDLDELFGRKYERAAETKPRQISEENNDDKKPLQEVHKSPDLTSSETEIGPDIPLEFMRPPRRVDIPPIIPIRVIKETLSQNTSVEFNQSVEVSKVEKISVLTPPEELKTTALPNPVTNKILPNDNQPIKKSSRKGILVFLSLIFILTILLGGLSLYLWQSSKQILSPIP